MIAFNASSTSTSCDEYNRFNRYYINVFGESNPPLKVKTITKDPPKKEKIHIFDIKDLDL